jgi:DNA-binding LytR/AlgR family response regulator
MPSISPRPEGRAVRALVVEDEEPLRDELCEALEAAWPALDIVDTAGDGETALRLVELHAPDLVFLDIRIPDPDGLEVARLVGDKVHVVFVTAYDAYALAAFERGAVDYLLKPLQPERLARVVQRLQRQLPAAPAAQVPEVALRLQAQEGRARPLRWLTATSGRSMRFISIDEVVFFQSDRKHTRVVLADSEVLVRRTLKELLAELDPDQFWQTHRSTVVNALEVAGVEPNMAGKLTLRLKRRREALPVSDAFMRRFRQA